MKRSLTLASTAALAAASVALTATGAHGQVLFADALDSEAAANVLRLDDSQDPDPDIEVTWVDYSNFSIEGVAHSIPEAPNPVAGGAPTRGVVVQANLFVGGAFGVNFLAADAPGGNPVPFTGDYKMSFDAYISVADPVPSGGTEQLLWGIGADGTELNARYIRQIGLGSGVWGWLAGENGYGTEDATIQEGPTELFDLGDTNDANAPALFNEAFEDTIPASVNNIPGNQWVHVEISALAGTVRVQFNGVTFFEAESTETEGFAFFGYEDTFSSISAAPAFQWGLFDNFVVEVAEPETITATLAGGFPVTNTATPGQTTVQLENRHSAAINITALEFTGADAAEFSADPALPLAVGPGGTVDFPVTWTPSEPTGTKTAELVLTTDDATTPQITITLNATFAPELLAHFPLDETAGAVLTEASGNGSNATLAQNTPAGLGQPPLASGTSIRFEESIFNPPNSTGSFALFPMLHTPSLSFTAWVQPEADASSEDVILNRSFKNGNTDDLYGLFLDDFGTLTFSVGGNPVVFSDIDAVLDDTAYHVAVTHLDEDGLDNDTATRTRLYIDGALVAEATGLDTFGYGPLSPDAQQQNVFIASRSQAASGYTGLLDDLQFYSIELSPEQIANAFNNPGSLAIDPPVATPIVITAVTRDAVIGDIDLTFTSANGKTYAVQTSTDLVTWNDDGPTGIPTGGATTSVRVTGLAGDARYLRVIEE